MAVIRVSGNLEVPDSIIPTIEGWLADEVLFHRISSMLELYISLGSRIEHSVNKLDNMVVSSAKSAAVKEDIQPVLPVVIPEKIEVRDVKDTTGTLARFRKSART